MASASVLYAGQVLHADGFRSSPSGQYFLKIQLDGNCLLYLTAKPDASHTFWGAGTYGRGAACTVTNRGQFIVQDKSGNPVFKSTEKTFPVDDSNDVPVWNSDSAKAFLEKLGH